MDKRNRKAILKGLAMLLGLAAVGWAARAMGLADAFDKSWVDANIRGQGVRGELLLLAFGALFTGLGLPRQAVCFLGGYAYGVWLGTGLGLLATMLGSMLSFYYARFLGRDFVVRRYGKRIGKLNAVLRTNPFTMTLIIRFLPVGSNLLTNLVGGVSHIPARWFFAGSMLGHLPQSFIFALLGSGVRVDPTVNTILSAGLFLLSSWMGYALYRRYKLESVMRRNGEG